MARNAANAAPKHVMPEEEPEGAVGKSVSKVVAVRAALDAGRESPEEGIDFVKQQYGIDVTKSHFSSIKSQYKKTGGAAQKSKPGRKPKAAANQAVEGYLAPPPKPQPVGAETDLLAAMEAMKPLVASLGADKVKRIVDLLG